MDLTATVITTIISLATVVGIVGKFISNQTKLEVQLVNIQKELAEINIKLDKRDNEIRCLSDRVIKIEENIKRER
jgi:tRNA1(Val) A37 N6-methylase TrmN6